MPPDARKPPEREQSLSGGARYPADSACTQLTVSATTNIKRYN